MIGEIHLNFTTTKCTKVTKIYEFHRTLIKVISLLEHL